MNFEEKRAQLCARITTTLTPLVNGDYLLLDLPFYANIGDTLIWEGTLHFLRTLPYKPLQLPSSYATFTFPPLPAGTVILLQGGGNFGDLWRVHQRFRLEVIARYPEHTIIMLPQTLHYSNPNQLLEDAQKMSKHRQLYLCMRDTHSFDVVQKQFQNHPLLLPDMAFCIPPEALQPLCVAQRAVALYLKRGDKELAPEAEAPLTSLPLEVKDWPSMEHPSQLQHRFAQLQRYTQSAERLLGKPGRWARCYLLNQFAHRLYRPHLVARGVRFLSSYQEIYTTRLHVAILAILLGKPFHFLDNSYGKNRSFFHTWLSDLEQVEFIEKK